MSAPNNQQNVTWHEFADNLAALVKKILPELDVELLAANKPSQRHKGDGPPRERNSFFIYKSHRWSYYRKQYKARGEKIHVPEVTKKISADWHAMPAQEQKKWRLAAILQQFNHRKANPNYKYSPNRGTQKKAAKRPRADGEGGRTRKKSCNENRADHPSIETRGMILEPFSVHQQSTDDTFVLNNNLLDDPVEFQALWNEFTNETAAATPELDTNNPDVNGAEPLVSMESLAIISADEVPGVEALTETFPFIDYTDASNMFNVNDSPYNVDVDVDLNQFVALNHVYNATPVSPTPTTPMLMNDISPILHDTSPILPESSPDTIGFDGADINNMGQAVIFEPYECDAFNGYALDGQYLFNNHQFSDWLLFNPMFDDAIPRDPAADD